MTDINKQSGIYQIRNLTNNKLYVGSAVNLKRRKYHHLSQLKKGTHNNTHLQRAYDKYGSDKFVFEVLEYVERDKLIEREQYFIDKLHTATEGYNQSPTAGSILGFKLSEEAKSKISKGNKGKKRSPECIEQMRQRNQGKKLSEEHKRKIGISVKGELNGNYGRQHTKAEREVISQKASGRIPWNKGRTYSEEDKIKMRAYSSNRGKTKASGQTIAKKVICIETGQIFPSIEAASKWAGLKSRSAISACCNRHIKSAGGYHWKFA